MFAFTLKPEVKNYTVFDVSDRLRQRGWLVPAYTFPENRQDLSVLRIVVRAGMNQDMADLLLEHLREETEFLESLERRCPAQPEKRQAFATEGRPHARRCRTRAADAVGSARPPVYPGRRGVERRLAMSTSQWVKLITIPFFTGAIGWLINWTG